MDNAENDGKYLPNVEIHVSEDRLSAAAGGGRESRLSPEQIAALQKTLATLVAGFRPPEPRDDDGALRLSSLEVELGFKIETGSGSMIKLIFDASAEASITAKIGWSRPK